MKARHALSVSVSLFALALLFTLGASGPDPVRAADAPDTGEIESIKFRFISVRKAKDATEAQRAAERAGIEEALRKIRAGEDFIEVAREYSEVPLEKRGLLIVVEPGEINPEIEKALLSLDEGEVSGIVETDTAYGIFRLDRLMPVFIPPTPMPTPTPMFERRLSARGISTYDFRPENSTIPYFIEDDYLWSPVKDAVFYAPVHVPDGVEVVGFNVWVRDTGGEERPHAVLFEQISDETSENKVIAERDSDGPWPEGELAMCHFPGAKHIAFNVGGNSLVAKVTLRSGDRNQAIHGGLVIFTFDSAEGHKMMPETIKYITQEQKHPGLCPLCVAREREQRQAWLRAMGKDVPNPQKSRILETHPELAGQSSLMGTVLDLDKAASKSEQDER